MLTVKTNIHTKTNIQGISHEQKYTKIQKIAPKKKTSRKIKGNFTTATLLYLLTKNQCSCEKVNHTKNTYKLYSVMGVKRKYNKTHSEYSSSSALF